MKTRQQLQGNIDDDVEENFDTFLSAASPSSNESIIIFYSLIKR